MGNLIEKSTTEKKNNNKNIIKFVSYNIDMDNAVNMTTRIDDIFHYFEEYYNGFQCDIMCIRGINNFIVYYKLLTILKKKYKNNIYIAPDYYRDNIDISNVSNENEIKQFFNKNEIKEFTKKRKKKVKNVIISRHKILCITYSELDDDIVIDDILGIHTIIGANIVINKKIITIYNTTLCPDIKYANVVNTYARKNELKTIFSVIENNIANLNEIITQEDNTDYILTNLQIVTGTFNTSVIEYATIINDMRCIDILTLVKEDKEYNNETMRHKSIYNTHGNAYIKDKRKGSSYGTDNQIYLSDYFLLYDNKAIINRNKSNNLKYMKKKIYENYNIYVVNAETRKNFYGGEYLLRPSCEVLIICK